MASNWPTMKLGAANVTLIDCDHRTPPSANSGYPYVAIPQLRDGHVNLSDARLITREHFFEWTRKAKPIANDVVLSRRCNPGETAFVPPDLEFALGQNLVLLRSDGTKVFPPFLRWLVRGPEWWEQIYKFINVGAIFDSLKCADIPNFELHIPPLPEQRAIAEILAALDDKIELNRRMNRTLESMAQLMFTKTMKDDYGSMNIGTVGEEFDLTMGQSPPGESYNENGEGKPFYQGCTDFGFRYPENRVYCTAPTRFAKASDTLVSVRAPVGDVNMAKEECAIGRGVAAIRHKTGSRSFTYYAMKSLEENFARFEAEGTVFGSINKADFQNLEFGIPSTEQVVRFEKTCYPIDQMIENNEKESRTLANLRDSLLPKLIRGEVRVKNLDINYP